MSSIAQRKLPSTAWKRGQSGNPNGRPPAVVDIAALARVHGPRCIEVAVELLDDPDSRIRLAALVALLDRGFGRPKQTFEADTSTNVLLLHLEAARAASRQLIEAQAEPVQQQEPANLLAAPVPAE